MSGFLLAVYTSCFWLCFMAIDKIFLHLYTDISVFMAKRILVVYYTQTGQMRDIVHSVASPLVKAGMEVVFEELSANPPFPYPWTSDQFFQAMPESVLGIPCELQPMRFSAEDDFQLVIVAWQPWYLSPSIPIHAFFQHEKARKVLHGKHVITVIGSRNMWVSGQNVIKQYIRDAGARLAGNIVLFDRAPNLLSVVSIIRWMFKGKKERFMKVIPSAGVADEDIAGASRFGEIIHEAIQQNTLEAVNEHLVKAGAIDVKPAIVMIEKRGIILFRLWAKFIRKKGGYGDSGRLGRVRFFKYYLLFVLYFVSPLASILYLIIKPFRKQKIKKQISLYQSVS